MRYLKKFSLVLTAVLAMLFVVGCSDDDNKTPLSSNPIFDKASIRVIHTSYDAPAVDVKVNDAVAISNLPYGQSSGYAELTAGTYNIKVVPTGMDAPVVIEADLPLMKDKEYTVYAIDQLNSITAVVTEDMRMPASSSAKVRFLHASPDAPSVDIKLATGVGPAVFSNIGFSDYTDYIEVSPMAYSFVVTAAGSTDEVFVFDPIMLQAGVVYTVIAHGSLTDNSYPFAVRAFVDNNAGDAFADFSFAATAQVLVAHASPDAPGVDLLIDDITVNAAPLSFPANTGYLTLASGTRNIKVNVSGTRTTVIGADLPLNANANYSIFAIDRVTNIQPLVLEDDLTAPAAGTAHARFLHLSPDAPAVDITLTDGTVVFGNKAFMESTAFTPLPAGTYDLQVRLAGKADVVLNLPGIMLGDGNIYTVFAKGLVNGMGNQALGAEIIMHNQ